MRIRTTILAAAVALLPVLAVAQTAAPDTGSATTAPSAGSNTTAGTATRSHHHHTRAERQKSRAEVKQKVQQLSATDKAKYDEIGKQIRELHQQRMQILGLKKS
jgi:hypothetical protein